MSQKKIENDNRLFSGDKYDTKTLKEFLNEQVNSIKFKRYIDETHISNINEHDHNYSIDNENKDVNEKTGNFENILNDDMDNLIITNIKNQIAENIKKLPSSALIGVVEILTKGNFKLENLPLNIDLRGIDAVTYHKLKKYVDSCIGDSERSETPTLYAWRPFEPDDLTTIRETYAVELQSWKAPPPDDVPVNTE